MRYGLGPEVLRDVTFHLAPGSFHFLTGPSGAGKSSLLRLLYLSRWPSRGLVTMFGRDLATTPREALPALRRRIGVVFQDFRLLDHLSVLENVALPLHIAGSGDGRIEANVRELLHWVGLGQRIEARPNTLSGGEQQRAAIARAVVTSPSLLLADEPTGNLDDRMGYRLMRLFQELHLPGTRVVVATHNGALMARFPYPRLHPAGGELGAVAPPEPADG